MWMTCKLAERGTEDQQPQRRLHHPGDEFGPVVLQLLQFDDRERADRGLTLRGPVAIRAAREPGLSVGAFGGCQPARRATFLLERISRNDPRPRFFDVRAKSRGGVVAEHILERGARATPWISGPSTWPVFPRPVTRRDASARPDRTTRRPLPCNGWSAARSCRTGPACSAPASRRGHARSDPAPRSVRRAPAATGG